jgi:hypothetical protein
VSFDDWKDRIAALLHLNENQIYAIYSTLMCFATRDPHEALVESQFTLANPGRLWSRTLRVTDFLVFLYALFVKKKFPGVAERSTYEAFPTSPIPQKVSKPLLRANASKSSPQIIPSRMEFEPMIPKDPLYRSFERFFLSRFQDFLRIYAPIGLTRHHVISLGLLLTGGPSLAVSACDLIVALNLFPGETQIESIESFRRVVLSALAGSAIEEQMRKDLDLASPVCYRPVVGQSSEDWDQDSHRFKADIPLLINNEYSHEPFIVEDSPQFCDVFIKECRQKTIYLCAALPAVFITHCKDTVVFIGAATAVHVEHCANVQIIAAVRTIVIESSVRSTFFLLTNTRPLLTGSCSKLVSAPYNALYRKLGLDLLSVGINPKLNLWDQPLLIGTLTTTLPEHLPPSQFQLICLPFCWPDCDPIVNAVIPREYSAQLEFKKNQIQSLIKIFGVIRERDPALYDTLQSQVRAKAFSWAQDRGAVNEVQWLITVAAHSGVPTDGGLA